MNNNNLDFENYYFEKYIKYKSKYENIIKNNSINLKRMKGTGKDDQSKTAEKYIPPHSRPENAFNSTTQEPREDQRKVREGKGSEKAKEQRWGSKEAKEQRWGSKEAKEQRWGSKGAKGQRWGSKGAKGQRWGRSFKDNQSESSREGKGRRNETQSEGYQSEPEVIENNNDSIDCKSYLGYLNYLTDQTFDESVAIFVWEHDKNRKFSFNDITRELNRAATARRNFYRFMPFNYRFTFTFYKIDEINSVDAILINCETELAMAFSNKISKDRKIFAYKYNRRDSKIKYSFNDIRERLKEQLQTVGTHLQAASAELQAACEQLQTASAQLQAAKEQQVEVDEQIQVVIEAETILLTLVKKSKNAKEIVDNFMPHNYFITIDVENYNPMEIILPENKIISKAGIKLFDTGLHIEGLKVQSYNLQFKDNNTFHMLDIFGIPKGGIDKTDDTELSIETIQKLNPDNNEDSNFIRIAYNAAIREFKEETGLNIYYAEDSNFKLDIQDEEIVLEYKGYELVKDAIIFIFQVSQDVSIENNIKPSIRRLIERIDHEVTKIKGGSM